MLGSGQLGRMFAIAARRMGYRVHTFSPDDDTPTGQVADLEVRGPYDDLDAVRGFARGGRRGDLRVRERARPPRPRPRPRSRRCARPARCCTRPQHRLREKGFLAAHGFPVTPFAPARSADGVGGGGRPRSVRRRVLKTAGLGYDGKGQAEDHRRRSRRPRPGRRWRPTRRSSEAFVDLALRGVGGGRARGRRRDRPRTAPFENQHRDHILDRPVAPAASRRRSQPRRAAIARAASLEALDVVGVLCVEFFLHAGTAGCWSTSWRRGRTTPAT